MSVPRPGSVARRTVSAAVLTCACATGTVPAVAAPPSTTEHGGVVVPSPGPAPTQQESYRSLSRLAKSSAALTEGSLDATTGSADTGSAAVAPEAGGADNPSAPACTDDPACTGGAQPTTTLDLARADVPDDLWVVVNRLRPLPDGYVPADLVQVEDEQVRAVVVEPLARMRADAAAQGVQLTLLSGYRSYEHQLQVHQRWTDLLGDERADQVSAEAGRSEHQTGLAVDLGSGSQPGCDLDGCFATTVEGQWLAEHAQEYGFLVRYTEQNQDQTGYAPEGWHLRYVGDELVTEMVARGALSLEQLFGLAG